MTPLLARKLLVIGWDAADWKLINPLLDAGLMPTLAGLVEQGCIGNLATLRPCLSPMLWTSIATGKRADRHGVLGFVEPLPDASGVRLVGSTTRQAKALWNITTQAGLRTHLIGWYATHPAEPINGVSVSDQFLAPPGADAAPVPADAIHPAGLHARLADLRVRPDELGPGDLLPFIPQLAEIDPADPRPAKLAQILAACASVHAVATDVLANHPWDVAFVYYDALDRAGHEFMPYHPPRMPQVSERDFALYRHVMSGLYRFHDMMLDTLLRLAGDDATVVIVSDHGFHGDHLRPAPPQPGAELSPEATAALWHRHYGVFAARGPGLRADERVYGASLLDVAPTLLNLLGLPVGRDMEGRALVELMSEPPKQVASIPSWDDLPGEAGMHPPERRTDAAASAAAMQQLIDLGYLAPQADGGGAALAALAARESQFNLAMVHLHARRAAQAIPILGQLSSAHAGETRYAIALAQALSDAGRHADALKVVKGLDAAGRATPDAAVLGAQAMIALGDRDGALEVLQRVEQSATPSVQLYCVMGGLYREQNLPGQAEAAFRKALAVDEENEQAHYGLGLVHLRSRRWESAAEHALRAVGLVHGFPQAHWLLGVALDELGETERALTSLRVAVSLAANFPEAHERLAAILLKQGDVESAMRHRRMASGDFSQAGPRG